ncbi:MAG: heme-binding domain-containing protein [Planctomycetes bacterium]|nr:heme-binding domain-containing protein [Planctomycetota bacterium]
MKKKILIVVVLILVGIQFVPVNRENPEVSGNISVAPEVEKILRETCYDCHSNETVWPWYSYVAPVSWKIAHDVDEGREHVNFSEWGSLLSEEDRNHAMEEAVEEIEKDNMPLSIYVWLHPDAALSDDEKKTLIDAFGGHREHSEEEHEHEHE